MVNCLDMILHWNACHKQGFSNTELWYNSCK